MSGNVSSSGTKNSDVRSRVAGRDRAAEQRLGLVRRLRDLVLAAEPRQHDDRREGEDGRHREHGEQRAQRRQRGQPAALLALGRRHQLAAQARDEVAHRDTSIRSRRARRPRLTRWRTVAALTCSPAAISS